MIKADIISRVRNGLKAVKQDAFMTDRLIYSVVLKYAKLYIKRLDDQNRLGMYQGLFETLPCVELIEVDKIEACCTNIRTHCKFMRTKNKLPATIEGGNGVFFRSVTSIDGSFEVHQTFPSQYSKIANASGYKYNKSFYYWFLNGYLYLPNVEWEAIAVEGLFDGTTTMYDCCVEDCCADKQSERAAIPDSLMAEIEQNVKQELMTIISIPEENESDNKSLLK